MANIGKFNQLKVIKQLDHGFYLDGGELGEILLPNNVTPDNCQIDTILDVFIYIDNKGRPIATTDKPVAEVDQNAWLKVVAVNDTGAFVDWGLPKDILVPYSEQRYELTEGRYYLFSIYLDDSDRIAASTRIDDFILDEAEDLEEGQMVSLLIADKTELGFKAIIDHRIWGLLYDNELFKPIKKGQTISGYVKCIREDKRVDLSLQPVGYAHVDSVSKSILDKLVEHDGMIMLSDKSAPDAIAKVFGISKKVFKKAIGGLYKKRLIIIEQHAIRLNNKEQD